MTTLSTTHWPIDSTPLPRDTMVRLDDKTNQKRQASKGAVIGLRPLQMLLVLAIIAVFAIMIATGILSPSGWGCAANLYARIAIPK